MKSVIAVISGIILLWAAFSRQSDVFYRVRRLRVKGVYKIVMRIIYASAGIFLIAVTLAGRLF